MRLCRAGRVWHAAVSLVPLTASLAAMMKPTNDLIVSDFKNLHAESILHELENAVYSQVKRAWQTSRISRGESTAARSGTL